MLRHDHDNVLAHGFRNILRFCRAISLAGFRPPRALVQRAVDTELAADRDDHSLWRYKVLEKLEDNSLYDSIDTSQGSLRRKIEQGGHPLGSTEQQAQTAKIQAFVNDPHAQAKQKRDGQHDDESAEKMLKILPRAFLWKVGPPIGRRDRPSLYPQLRLQPS